MVFSATNLFKGIQCPQGEACTLTHCIFAHDLRPQASAPEQQTASTGTATQEPTIEPPTKRRRVTYDKAEDKPLSKADLIRSELAQSKAIAKPAPSASGNHTTAAPLSLERAVSPPAKAGVKVGSPATTILANNNNRPVTTPARNTTIQQKLQLNPKRVPNDPAGHVKRTLYLKHLHAEMVRLNQQLAEKKDVQYKAGLVLLENELIQLALDEEEKVATESGAVYPNVIKNRIAAYRKMKPDDWIAHVKGTPFFISKQAPPAKSVGNPDEGKPVETGLTAEEEVAVLQHLVIKDQKPLAKYGYIPTPPTTEEAAEAAAAVEASGNYEECDRCKARFQVFPQRNEDGLLTSNGKCRHHPNRKFFPPKTKADTGPKEPYHPCCGGAVGSPGCAEQEHHVFKTDSPKRLAAVLPFIYTPENDAPAKDKHGRKVKAVAFDCEMGYTTVGMEVIRLTATSWPEGEELVDVLVRPYGIILDLNSRFSGVWPEDIARAIPFGTKAAPSPPPPPPQVDGSADTPPPPPPPLTIVDSPAKARELLCSFLTPEVALIGHAIDNDLNVVRLCHPTIVDTVIAFPHPRGLPLRYGLKMLSSKYLGRAIQQGGDRGHDSLEDAVATGDLARVRVGKKWVELRNNGWKLVDGKLVSPALPKSGERATKGDANGGLADQAFEAGRKRKKRSSHGEADGEAGNGLKSFLERGKDAEDGLLKHELSVAYLESESIGVGK